MSEPADEKPHRRFLPLETVAEILAIGLDDAEALVGTGQLRAIDLGAPGGWRVEVTELDAFIAAKYEEARRRALFDGFDFGSIADLDPPSR